MAHQNGDEKFFKNNPPAADWSEGGCKIALCPRCKTPLKHTTGVVVALCPNPSCSINEVDEHGPYIGGC